MRMRRFLAFVLAVVMLMSNTVTASATSSSSTPEGENLNVIQNEDGSYTISPTEVDDEDDESTDEDLDTPSGDEEQEPNGDGTGDEPGEGSDDESGDESDDGSGDEGDDPNGGDNENTNPGGDGGDVDDPNGEGEDGDDSLNPEEGEGEDTVSEEEQLPDENTVSENSVSENTLEAPAVLLNEISYEDAVGSIQLEGSGESVFWATIEDIEDYLEENQGEDKDFTIYMSKDFTLSEDLDFSEYKYRSLDWSLAYNELTIAADVCITIGDFSFGTVNVAEGKTLTLKPGRNGDEYSPKSVGLFFYDVDFVFDSESASGGIIFDAQDDEGNNVGNCMVNYCSFENLDNKSCTIKGRFQYMDCAIRYLMDGYVYDYANGEYNEDTNAWEYEQLTDLSSYSFDVGTLRIEGEDSEVFFETPLSVNDLYLEGMVEVFSFNHTGWMYAEPDSVLAFMTESTINNVQLYSEDEQDCMLIQNIFMYDMEGDIVEKTDTLPIYTGEVYAGEGFISLSKQIWEMTEYEEGHYSYDSYSGQYDAEELLAKVSLSNSDLPPARVTSQMSVSSSKWLGIDVIPTGVANEYELKTYLNSNDIRLHDSVNGTSRGFTNLTAVKEYIVEQNNSDADYYIDVNKNITLSNSEDLYYADNIAAGVEFCFNDHTLTVNTGCTIRVNYLSDAKIKMNQSGLTLTILDRPKIGEDYVDHTSCYEVEIISSATKLVCGDVSGDKNSEISLRRMKFTNSFANVELYGNTNFYKCNTLTVSNVLKVQNYQNESENIWQCARFEKSQVTTKDLDAKEGIVQTTGLKSTGTAYLSTQYPFFILPDGTATFTNVDIVNPGENPNPYNKVTMIFQYEDAETVSGNFIPNAKGTWNINGTIKTDEGMKGAFNAIKEYHWMEEVEVTEGEGEDSYTYTDYVGRSRNEEFENDELIATVAKSAVTAKYFSVEGDGRCTKKIGNEIIADTVSIRVHYNGYVDESGNWVESDEDLTYEYYSFQDAVANLAADFDSRVGEYDFSFITDDVLSANVTLPAFVQTAILGTDEDGEDVWNDEGNEIIDWIGNGQFFQQFLDLNGKTLTTSGSIRLERGLRINSNALDSKGKIVDGKIVSTFGECALGISEGHTLIAYEGKDIVEIDPAPVLENVVVTATNGGVNLYAPGADEYWLNASFETRGFFIDGGNWSLAPEEGRYIKATDLNVNGEWTEEFYNENDEKVGEEHHPASRLCVGSITLNNGGAGIGGRLEATDISVASCSLEVYENASLSVTNGIVLNNANMYAWPNTYTEVGNTIAMSAKSRLEVYSHLQTENITMDASKVFVADSGNLYVFDTMQIPAKKAAYAADSVGDYTVENHGQISVANISVPVGTFANYRTIEANTVKVKDFIAGDDTSFICNTFANTGKATFHRLGRLLVNGDENPANVDGTLNNVYLCGYDNGLHDYALIGRAGKANVTLTGTFTSENERQRAIGFISNHYEAAFGNEGVESAENYGWDRVWLSIMENVDSEGNIQDGSVFRFEILDDDDILFNTTISAFPVDKLRLLGLDYWNDWLAEKHDGKAVYQNDKSLKVIGEYINIYAELPNYERSHLKSFTNWKDASAYLNALNSKTTTYIVEIKEDIDLGQTLDLPANVKQIVFCSGKGSGEGVNWIPEKVQVTFQGDITLKTDTSFENIKLDAYTLDKKKERVEEYQPTIDTKGKFFALRSVEFEDGKVEVNGKEYGGIKALKGTSTSYVHFVDTDVAIASKVSGIHEMVLTHGVDLLISGGLSVNNLIIDKFWDREEAPDPCSVRVNGSSSTLEVKKLLEMRGQTSLICDGKMKFADVITNVEGNIFSTAGKEAITITGVVGTDDMTMQYLEPRYQEITDPEYGTFNLLRGFAKSEDETDYQVMKNAICILANTTPNGETPEGITVVTAEKVSPIWFAIQNPGYYEAEGIDVAYANLVHKAGKNHVSGLPAPEDIDILLYADIEGHKLYLNSFGTLQEAFTEIDRIGGPDINFIIEVTGDDDAIVKGKPGNYTFPSKAAEVQIVGATGAESINYKDGITLKSNVVFANVNLVPSAKGTISVGNYRAIFENVTIDDSVKTSINGSGTGKGSRVTIAGGATSMHITGDLTNVETLVVGETEVQVDGKISAGTLILPEEEILTCLGTIAIGDVYTVNGTIQTIPVYTRNITKTEITKVSSNLTISGDVLEMPSEDEGVKPHLTITFVEVNNGEIGEVDLTDETLNGLTDLVDADGAGITIAKAVNVDTDAIGFGNALRKEEKAIGTIYKKAGTLVYKCSDPVILLQYVDNSGSEVETRCESFADAVTEINNLKTKRDYTMGIYGIGVFNPGTLTMPNAKYVDTLTICPMDCARAEIQYMNNITFTSNVVLENIDFVQIVKNGKYEDGSTKYEPVNAVKAETGAYPSAVSVSVAGAYFVSIVNDLDKNLVNNKVTFNTPITLNGNKKAILNIGEGGTLQTLDVGSNYEPWAENAGLVQGKITGFAEMNVFSPISLYGYSSLNSKKVETYNATELNVTNLNVSNGAAVVVGQDVVINNDDKVTVTNLNLTNGTLETSGIGTFTNVVLGDGVDTLAVYGQTFIINGNLTSLTSDAELITGLTKKSESALYVKGNVVLGDAATDVICVNVTENGNDPYILGQTTVDDKKNSTLLLKAKTADVNAFTPALDCVIEENEYDPAAPEDGYILKKTGENIQVYYGSEIGVALCGPAAENGAIAEVINYYPTYNDAVAAIEALNVADAEYAIVVIQPVGSEDSPVALSMPSKAAKVTVVGYAGNAEKEVIYYTNAPSLKTDMVFANVTLAPEKVSKKVVSPAKLGITTGNFDITLQDIAVTGENAGIAKITGKNTATIKLDSEGLVINGDISAAKELIVTKNANVTGSVSADVTTVEAGKTVTVDGKFTAKKLNLNGASVVDAQKAAVTITDIESIGSENTILYGRDNKNKTLLTIQGYVKGDLVTLINNTESQPTLLVVDKTTVSLADTAKLANISKEYISAFEFRNAQEIPGSLAWAKNAVYCVPSTYTNDVTVTLLDGENAIDYINCLDMSQAATFINNRSDRTASYQMTFEGDVYDTSVTDKSAVSAFALPGKDKAEKFIVDGSSGTHEYTCINFSGNVATYGAVELWDINYTNAKQFNITNTKNSDIKGETIEAGEASLLLDSISVGNMQIGNITGTKGATDLTIRNSFAEIKGGISNVETCTVLQEDEPLTMFTVKGKSTIGKLIFDGLVYVEFSEATTITDIDVTKQSEGAYLATNYPIKKVGGKSVSSGIPQITVTGNVNGNVKIMIYDAIMSHSPLENYDNAKLVNAKNADANSFIATEYALWADGTYKIGEVENGKVVAYKDASGYVCNGDISKMEVLLTETINETNEEGNIIDSTEVETYVKTYADAVKVINNQNNSDGIYEIQFIATESNTEEGTVIIKTAVDKNGESTHGSLTLPEAKKATALTITGIDDQETELQYTSGLKPACDVRFENITLTEGTLDKKGNYTALNYITPNLDADVTITFGEGVKIADVDAGTLAFNTISGKKGELAFEESYDIEARGAIALPKLDVAAEKTLSVKSEKAIAITNIYGGDNVNLSFDTYFTNKAWKKAATQLSITGDVLLGEDSVINVNPFIYDTDTNPKTYKLISPEQIAEMMVSASTTPVAWQKVITAPKMQTMDGNITLCEDGNIKPIKYNGGIYFTDEDMAIVLRGIEITDEKFNEIIANPEEFEYEYEAHFLTWDEAVKEIDRINSKQQFYVIELHGDLGVETPLKTLTMPSKAYGLLVQGISDVNDESPDIMMTGTTITAKCNVAFDNVGITAVKMTGNNYYSVPFTLNTGNFEVEIENMPDMCRFFVRNGEWAEERGQYDSEMKVTGSAKGSFTYTPCEDWYHADESGFVEEETDDGVILVGGPNNDVNIISQISKVGNVILNTGSIVAARWDNEGNVEGDPIYAAYNDTYYYVPNGISGVNSFVIASDVIVDCAKTDFNVKDLLMGNPEYDENGNWTTNENADVSGLSARNITVSGLLTMASSWMHAGTSTVGDGKVTLTNVIFQDNHNTIEGKQDKNGNSLIQIKGTVGTDNEEMRICDSAVTIGLFYNNSNQNYVRVSEGMNLLTAPKAASSWFRPSYGWYNEETDEGADNMGWEITVEKAAYPNGKLNIFKDEDEWVYETEEAATYGLYKSGNNIKYGQICEVFEYEYEHVISEEESVILNIVDVRDMAEARLWIGTNAPAWDAGQSAYLDFMTFEEAVKAIDSLNQKNERYCIELLRTVEIGNTAGNGKYSSLALPSKANVVTICGHGENSLIFTGNVSLKCNTVFDGVQFSPVKLVKNEVVPAEVNISAGNYALLWNHSDICFAYQEEGEWMRDYPEGISFANITGSSKGSLYVVGDSYLIANNVTGFGKIEFTDAGGDYGWIFAEGNVQANEIYFTNNAKAKLRVLGNITVNAVYLEDDVDAQFRSFRDKALKINGAQAKDENGDLMTDENGKKLYDSVITFGDEDLQLFTYESGGTTRNETGSKLVTGKYLDSDDWQVFAVTEYDDDGNETIGGFSDYTDAACTGLYLGKPVVQPEP